MNWLSARKTRLHGMKDGRWNISDITTQYKGLINLYERDFKILKIDQEIELKKQKLKTKKLKTDIDSKRNTLHNLISGDRQQIRNTLREHRDLLLAYQQLPPIKVIENIHQDTFNKRKKADRQNYEKKIRSKRLIDLKLNLAVLEDRIKYATDDKLDVEEQAQVVTGRVQNAILKKEAALAVKNAYINIRDIMKKDAIYFDVVLQSLSRDAKMQGKCMIRATELGQLATEYLDDRRIEYHKLENAVKFDMKERESNLHDSREQLTRIGRRIRTLIRRDSDVNIGRVILPESESDNYLKRCLNDMERVMDYLKHALYVSNYDCIYPCLEGQKHNGSRLRELVDKLENQSLALKKKIKHARVELIQLKNNVVETTNEYILQKTELQNQINQQQILVDDIKERLQILNDTITGVEIDIKQLVQLSVIISDPNEPKERLRLPIGIEAPTDKFTNVFEIFQILASKLKRLLANVHTAGLTAESRNLVLKHFNALMNNRSIMQSTEVAIEDIDLIDEISLDQAGIPQREDIKRESALIVEENAKLLEFEL